MVAVVVAVVVAEGIAAVAVEDIAVAAAVAEGIVVVGAVDDAAVAAVAADVEDIDRLPLDFVDLYSAVAATSAVAVVLLLHS